jgi:transcriptional regulator with XRE-family HTH domain
MTNFLKKIREDKKIGQTELANRIGVTKQLLSGFENGRSGISNEVLIKLAEELQVSPDAILTGKSYKPLDQKNRQHLSEAMSMTFKNYGDEFDKDTIIKISTELYSLIVDFHELNNDSNKQNFVKSLEEKIAVGLAAKCLLKNIKNS